MAKTALKEEEFNFPAGGIADFYMEDDEIAALEQAEAKEAFGDAGIANFQEIAGRMASYGRYGDDTVAHVETGELIIPKALIEDNPKLRDSIFGHLEEMGVEDPERYVVGSGANSINPETGLPEFFFKAIKRAVSKVVKGVTKAVKKVVKSVGKVIKKVAPIVLPIALSFTPLGPVYGAALGSGIGTLVQGGDLKDAMKSALIAGGTGALFSGFTGKGTFTQNVSKAVADPVGRMGQTLSGAGSTFTGGGFTGEGNLFTDYVPTAEVAAPQASSSVSEQVAAQADAPMDATQAYEQAAGIETVAPAEVTAPPAEVTTQTTFDPKDLSTAQVQETPGFFDSVKGALTPGDDITFTQGMKDAFFPTSQSATELMQANPGMSLDVAKQIVADTAPGLLRTYGPMVGAGTALAAGAGFFEKPEDPNLTVADIQEQAGPTGEDLIAGDPNKYLVGGSTPYGAAGPYSVATNYAYNPQTGTYNINPFGRPQYVADGGEIFPRRTGGIMPDEGIPNQDSVRAMLMPGEFVMTTDAVRGLGGGNLRQGINNMYGMMRNLEARGKAMA